MSKRQDENSKARRRESRAAMQPPPSSPSSPQVYRVGKNGMEKVPAGQPREPMAPPKIPAPLPIPSARQEYNESFFEIAIDRNNDRIYIFAGKQLICNLSASHVPSQKMVDRSWEIFTKSGHEASDAFLLEEICAIHSSMNDDVSKKSSKELVEKFNAYMQEKNHDKPLP